MRKYPRITVDIGKLKNNVRAIKKVCGESGTSVAFVVKGCNGMPEAVRSILDENVEMIATSRLEQFEEVAGYKPETKRLMLRIPALSELYDTVRLADISLVSEISTLMALNAEAERQGKVHGVILMADLGDLREGFWEKQELLAAAVYVVNEAESLSLEGVGTNLGCYGSIDATREKMDELVDIAKAVEKATGKTLKYISGGGTTSMPRILNGDMPKEVNMLRIGEGLLTARDLQDIWHCAIPGVEKNIFTLEAEISEVKDKPTYPQGEIKCDAFGFVPEYEDRGIRRRAIASIGRVDYGYPEMLEVLEEGVTVIGASSDHTILDIQDAKRKIETGDIIKFGMKYANTVFVTGRQDIAKNIKK